MENLVRFSWHVGKYENISYYPRPPPPARSWEAALLRGVRLGGGGVWALDGRVPRDELRALASVGGCLTSGLS